MLAWIVQLGYTAGLADTPPEPEPTPTVTPAGKARKRRYYVEIDGQQFLVDSEPEARQLLEHARALAERQAEQLADKAVRKLTRKRKVPRVRIDAPVVKASPELDLSPLIADINRLYRQAAVNAELRLRLAQLEREEQDEEDELLLLL